MDYSQSLKPGISVKPLQQGLWIQQQGGLYYQTAEWIVLMSVSSPPPTKKLLDFANILETQIKTVSPRFPQLSDSLTSRLNWCRSVLQRLEPGRTKRAPLGFIGRLSHTLFGTVTEAELAQYRNLLMDNRLSLNHTIHRTNLLMSAVKSNREHINWNSDHIMRLQKYLQTLQSSISSSFKIMSDTVHHLSLKMKLEHALVTLEQSTHRILSQLNRRRRQMNSLYRHSLTEDVLPPTQLSQVLEKARSLKFTTMPLSWYYQYCKVSPVWNSVQEVTFKVHLPLHDGKNYILYSLHSFLFPIKPGFATQVQVKPKIAYSSTTGLLFEPILCQGGPNKVCRGGPLYDSTRFQCERALISRNSRATEHCKIRIIPNNDTVIMENSPGIYILSTPAVNPKLHCDSRGEEFIKFTPGVYMVSLNHSCTLRGEDWTLPGLKQFVSPLHISNQVPPISLRSIFLPYSKAHLEKIAEAPRWTPIKRLPLIKLDPLPPPATFLSLPHLETLTWINSSFIFIVVFTLIAIVVAIKVCRRYKPFTRFRQRRAPSAPEELEMHPKDEPTTVEPTPSIRLPRYPDLSREIANQFNN